MGPKSNKGKCCVCKGSHLTLCFCLWLNHGQRAPDGTNGASGFSHGMCCDGNLAFCQAGPPSVLLSDPSLLGMDELFKCCTLLDNRHNILKVLQSNIYAARKHCTLSLNSHVIYLFSFSDLSVLYQNWRI